MGLVSDTSISVYEPGYVPYLYATCDSLDSNMCHVTNAVEMVLIPVEITTSVVIAREVSSDEEKTLPSNMKSENVMVTPSNTYVCHSPEKIPHIERTNGPAIVE